MRFVDLLENWQRSQVSCGFMRCLEGMAGKALGGAIHEYDRCTLIRQCLLGLDGIWISSSYMGILYGRTLVDLPRKALRMNMSM